MTKIPNFTDVTKYILNSKVGKYMTNPRAAGAAVAIATVSNVTKDGVNCAYYVTQSLHNERIPEDQRKFVAGLDLANGLLNVVLQSFAGAAIGKAAAKFFDNIVTPKYFSEYAIEKMYQKVGNKMKYDEFKGIMEKNKGFAKSGLSVIAALVGMQIVVKRIIVPLIATPLATIFKNQFEKAEQAKHKEKQNDKLEETKEIDD